MRKFLFLQTILAIAKNSDAFFVIFDRHCEKFNFQMEPGD